METNKKYQIIYADPPWMYDFTESDSRKIENHYPVMKLEDIKNLKIPKEKNSVLYLWATAPKLEEAIQVLNAWGYKYRTCLCWDKECIGMGRWFRNQHELLLVGLSGVFPAPIPSLRISSMLKIRRCSHSDKPDYIRAMIDKWYPDKTKLEMFYREKTPLFKKEGWDVWGNEVESDITLTPNLREEE